VCVSWKLVVEVICTNGGHICYYYSTGHFVCVLNLNTEVSGTFVVMFVCVISFSFICIHRSVLVHVLWIWNLSRTACKIKAASSAKTLVPLYHSTWWRQCPWRLQCAAPCVGAFNDSFVRQQWFRDVSYLNIVAIVCVYNFGSHYRQLYRICNLQHLNMEMYVNGSYDGQTSLLPKLLMWKVTVLGMACLCSVAEHIRETDYDSHNFMEDVFFITKIN